MRLSRRSAIVALLSLSLGNYRAFAAQAGRLTIDLGQWAGVRVSYKGQSVELTPEDIFEALQEERK